MSRRNKLVSWPSRQSLWFVAAGRVVVVALAVTLLLHCGAPKVPGHASSTNDVVTIDDARNAQRGLDHLNAIRQRGALAPVALSRDMSADAALHARYLALNAGRPEIEGLLAHNEDVRLPGATVRGAVAGGNSVIAFNSTQSSAAIDEWLGTLYHRIPLLRRELRVIGIGRSGTVHVLFVTMDEQQQTVAPVVFPYADSVAPSQGFVFGEVPEPRPSTWFGDSFAERATMRSGFPVTATFGLNDTISGVHATLTSNNEPLEVALSSPELPATAFPQGKVIAMLPRHALRADTTYRAHIEYVRNGTPGVLDWSFRTVPYLPFENNATQAPAVGTLIRLTTVVAHAHESALCDRLDNPATCKSHVLMRLEQPVGAALAIEVRILTPAESIASVLALIGHRVRLVGAVSSVRAGGFTVTVENPAALAPMPDDLPTIIASDIGPQHAGRVVLIDVAVESTRCDAASGRSERGTALRTEPSLPPVDIQLAPRLRMVASAEVWSTVCKRIGAELQVGKKAKGVARPRRLLLRGCVIASNGGSVVNVSSPSQLELAPRTP